MVGMIDRDRLLASKRFYFSCFEFFKPLAVELNIPDLRDNYYRAGGDWGLEVSVGFLPDQFITIRYRDEEGNVLQESRFNPEVLHIESPLLHDERQKTPWCYLIDDVQQCLSFRIYVDAAGRLHHVETKRYTAFRAVMQRRAKMRLVKNEDSKPSVANQSSFHSSAKVSRSAD